MNRIGIIGVGEIGKAMVEGICEGDGEAPEVLLSPRGAATAADLASRYANVRVCADNREVAERADLLIVALRRRDRHEALDGVRVDASAIVVNVMAGVPNDELRQILGTDAVLVQAIPLPAVRERRGVTVVHPSHPETDALFDLLGGAQPVADPAAFDVFSALASTISTDYAYLTAITSWAVDQGVPAEAADRYVRGLFQGVGRALGDRDRPLARLAADHETPGGSNERIRTTWFGPANVAALEKALDDLLADLR